MIVDDSTVARTALSRAIAAFDDLLIVGVVSSAELALSHLANTPVDIVLLDLEMPGMGGMAALPLILQAGGGCKVLVVSSLSTRGARITIEALSRGASDALPKPGPGSFNSAYALELVKRLRAISGRGQTTDAIAPVPRKSRPEARAVRSIGMAASTGGIQATVRFLSALPDEITAPIFLTQHLPQPFIEQFAKQIRMATRRATHIADDGVVVQERSIYIAPGDGHLTVVAFRGQHVLGIEKRAVANGCSSSADPMFASLAHNYGRHAVGVVLTGMGRDGASGAAALAKEGGIVVAQDAASSVVFGMPRAIIEDGVAVHAAPPDRLARFVAECAK